MRSVSIAIAALLSATASAASCDLESLVPLLVDKRNDACEAASGVAFPPRKGAEWQKTCNVEACTSFYTDLLSATPSECTIGSLAAHADIVNQHRSACGLPLADAGPVQSTSSSSGSLDSDVSSQDLVTPAPTTATPAPTTTAPPKRNSTTSVEALTNSAPLATSASTLAVAVSVVAAAIATLAL